MENFLGLYSEENNFFMITNIKLYNLNIQFKKLEKKSIFDIVLLKSGQIINDTYILIA